MKIWPRSRGALLLPRSSELRVLDRLREVDLGSSARVLHSLNESEPDYQNSIDFIIASELGILALLVIGGGIGCSQGMWRYTDRFDRPVKEVEGPFRRAEQCAARLREALSRDIPGERVGDITVGYGIVFADCQFSSALGEWPRPAVIDADAVRDYKRFHRAIYELYRYWASGTGEVERLPPGDIDRLVRLWGSEPLAW